MNRRNTIMVRGGGTWLRMRMVASLRRGLIMVTD
jgi:hypothetical protein